MDGVDKIEKDGQDVNHSKMQMSRECYRLRDLGRLIKRRISDPQPSWR